MSEYRLKFTGIDTAALIEWQSQYRSFLEQITAELERREQANWQAFNELQHRARSA